MDGGYRQFVNGGFGLSGRIGWVEMVIKSTRKGRLHDSRGTVCRFGWLAVLTCVGLPFWQNASAQEKDKTAKTKPIEAIEKAIQASESEKKDANADYTVSGRFVAPGGAELTEGFGGLFSQSKNSGTSATIGVKADGSFSYKVRGPASVFVYPQLEGFARRTYGPFEIAEGPVDLGDLPLEVGYSAQVLIQRQDGVPLSDVKVESVRQWVSVAGRRSALSPSQVQGLVSGADGLIRLTHMTDHPVEISVRHNGYEYARREFVFEQGETIDWKLTPTAPLTGKFVDSDGKPLEGVELHLAHRDGPFPTTADPRDDFLKHLRGEKRYREPIAESDGSGNFRVESLRSDTRHWLMALHPDSRPMMIKGVSSGEQLGEVTLEPPLVVKGQIKGDLSKLGRRSGRRYIQYRNVMSVANSNHETGFRCDVDDQGRFVATQLLPGVVKLYVADQSMTLRLTKSIEELVFDLENPQPPPNADYRAIRLVLNPVDDQPLRGQVQLSWRLSESPEIGPKSGYKNLPAAKVIDWEAPPGATLWFHGSKLVGSIANNQLLGTVPKGEGPQEYMLDLDSAGLVSGKVVEVDGTPVPEFRIDIDRSTRQRHFFQIHGGQVSHEQGKFALGPLPLGAEHEYRAYIQVANSWRLAISEPFRVSKERPVRDGEFVMPPISQLSGRVVDLEGEPLVGVKLSLNWYHSRTSRSIGTHKKTDEEGKFRIQISGGGIDGECRFTIHPHLHSAGKTLTFQAGEYEADHDYGEIRMQPSSTIRGFVMGPDGRPRSNVSISLNPIDRENADFMEGRNAKSDVNGAFEITGVERVPQRLFAFGQRLAEVTSPFEPTTDSLGNEFWMIDPFETFSDVTIIVK